MNRIPSLTLICFGLLGSSCTNQSQQQQQRDDIFHQQNTDDYGVLDGVFDIPELHINPSPENGSRYTFPDSENIIDYEVSPEGITVAVISERDKTSYLKFWKIGHTEISDSCLLPPGLIAKSIAWHPLANAIFIMGIINSDYHIYRIEKGGNNWISKSIYSSPNQLRRLIAAPRPFITDYQVNTQKHDFAYRLFFGMDNGNKTFRIVSVTEHGNRFYQVAGPSKTFTSCRELDADADPSLMEADWALPIAFHPAGHQMIWQDRNNKFFVATYESKAWGQSRPMKTDIKNNGTITPTPNGLGLIHWQKEKPGIGIHLIPTNSEDNQLSEFQFISTPSSVPDGKGIVGLTRQNKRYTLNYLPVNMPLADVTNAWMFIHSNQETELFKKQNGLFRPNQDDQLYKLYETENYYCNSYDRSAPTRPYLVTTDLFWELFGAAYQGLFIVKERDEAIPNFWNFVDEADKHFESKNTPSKWNTVFSALKDLRLHDTANRETRRIMNAEDNDTSDVHGENYPYSDLKPRGHYTSSPEMESYFKAFRYFTTILNSDRESMKELETLPAGAMRYAENWINSYSGFLAPSRSPLVWKNVKQSVPGYCQYPQKSSTTFPLSWGFDNEVFYSTVYHETFSEDLQIKGNQGLRLLPLGLDIAAAFGNGLAENILSSDYESYPPLKKVIGNLKGNFKKSADQVEFKDNLYHQWLNAISVQWADSVSPPNKLKDDGLWKTKRLQTGLATWATLRHATILVNERVAAECGEGGFEEILMKAPRGYVEPDPYTFAAIADLFENAVTYVSKTTSDKSDISENYDSAKRSLYDGIVTRLKEAAHEARVFQAMAEKERNGEMLNNEENEKILHVARTAEHLFLIFNSLSNNEYALSNPDPMPKIADVAADGTGHSFLMAAVGNSMEWNFVVPFYGRHQIVKGATYSYYEFKSSRILNDTEWREMVNKQEFLPWLTPYITSYTALGMAKTGY